jgi:branched-chain amino acid transport system substrate-binding protein
MKMCRPMRRLCLSFGLAMVVGSFPNVASSDEALAVNVILSLTGPAAFVGVDEKQALQVYENLVNKSGGVKGRSVHFQLWDDQSSPQVALQLANGIIEKHVPVIIGPAVTGTCAAVEPVVRNTGPVEYCLSPGLQPQKGTFVFSSSRSLDATLLAEARFLNEKSYNRIGVLTATDASGQAGSHALYDAMPSYQKLQIVDEEKFAPTAISLNAEISKIMQLKPQCIFIFATGPAFATALRGLKDAGVDLPVFTSSANLNKQQLDQYTAFLPRDLYFDGFPFQVGTALGSAAQRSAYAAFVAAFKAAGVVPTTTSAYAWDPTSIVISAFKRIGPDATAEQIRDYIVNLHDFAGVNGMYDFRPGDQHGLGTDSVVVVKWSPTAGQVAAASQRGGKPL